MGNRLDGDEGQKKKMDMKCEDTLGGVDLTRKGEGQEEFAPEGDFEESPGGKRTTPGDVSGRTFQAEGSGLGAKAGVRGGLGVSRGL